MNYEKWTASERPTKTKFSLNYVGVASGYLNGHLATITTQLYAGSIEDAMRMFGELLGKAGLMGLTDYHVTRKDS